MSNRTNLVCDLCDKTINKLKDIGELDPAYQVNGRVVYVCEKCGDKVNKKLEALRIYYGNEMAKDVREWLLAEFNKKKPLILTSDTKIIT